MPFILISQLSHSIMFNKSYGWIHWFGVYQQFHHMDMFQSLKSQCLLKRRLHISLRAYIHTWGWLLWLLWSCYLLKPCHLLSRPFSSSCPSNSIGPRGTNGLPHIFESLLQIVRIVVKSFPCWDLLKLRRISIKLPLQIVREIVAKDFFLRFSLILAAGLLREFTEMVEFSPRFFRFF